MTAWHNNPVSSSSFTEIMQRVFSFGECNCLWLKGKELQNSSYPDTQATTSLNVITWHIETKPSCHNMAHRNHLHHNPLSKMFYRVAWKNKLNNPNNLNGLFHRIFFESNKFNPENWYCKPRKSLMFIKRLFTIESWIVLANWIHSTDRISREGCKRKFKAA